jgi:hypothetical protein
MKTELDTRSKELFDAIDGLNGMFKKGFEQNGIFYIGGKLVTYAEIQNALRNLPNASPEIKTLFSGAYDVGKYVDIEKNIGQLASLLNIPVGQQMPINQPQIVQPPQQPFVQQQQQPFVQPPQQMQQMPQQPSIGNEDTISIYGTQYPISYIIKKLENAPSNNIILKDIKQKLNNGVKLSQLTQLEKQQLNSFIGSTSGGKHLKKHKKTKVKRQSKRKRKQRFSKRRKSKAFRSKKA